MNKKYWLFPIALIILVLTIALHTSLSKPPEFPNVNSELSRGQLTNVQNSLVSYLQAQPKDPEASFSLGISQFLEAVETLSQSLYRYGLNSKAGEEFGIPFLRLPIPLNPDPEPINYQKWRLILEQFEADLATVDETIALVEDNPVKLTLEFGKIRLDLNGDSRLTEGEEFWRIYSLYNPAVAELDAETLAFPIAFDTGDAYWLRGYVNLLSAVTNIILAHDSELLFDTFGHLFFPSTESPHREFYSSLEQISRINWVDIIAMIHLLRLDPIEQQRMQLALNHLETTINLSRLSWNSILAEEDNDREWIPNPQQESVIPARVSEEQINSWLSILEEGEAILQGKKLVPHWRVQNPNMGINLNRIFIEPRTLDFVLWVHGSGIIPYLESGEVSDRNTWLALIQAFGRNFIGFSIWFN